VDPTAGAKSVQLVPGRLVRVDVGGFRLAVRCVGRDGPVVVLESGYGLPSAYWSDLQARLSPRRSCAYDRAGLGRSDPRPRDAETTPTDELRALLRRAGVAPPYVLVGHSYGGLLVRAFEAQYRGTVRAVVLLDAISDEPSGGWISEGGGLVNAGRLGRIVRARGRLGALPLVVAERGRNRDPGWSAGQRRLARLASRSRHVVALTSFHSIHEGQPAFSAHVVTAAVHAAQPGRALPTCERLVASFAARCVR